MKFKEISEKYGVHEIRFEMFIDREGGKRGIKTKGFLKDAIADEDVERAVKEFKEYEATESPEAQRKKREEEERLRKEKEEREERERADRAIANAGGLWEYKVISLIDEDSGGISPARLEAIMNSLGSYGWHLKVAYANEVGRNSNSSGSFGSYSGTNATIDQNILIFERFIKTKTE